MLKSAPHPLHVPACCAAIALERLSWYALLAGLVTWLARFGHADGEASLIVGYVVSAAYAAPLLGAQVADRLTGYRLAAVLGALAFAAGYALMGLSAPIVGLALVSVGNGLFKPAIMSLLSGASMAGSPERTRDNGRLYAAINVGSLPAGLVGGYLSAGHSLRFLFLSAATALAALVLLASWRVLRGGEWRSEVEALTQAPMDHQPTYRAPWLALGALLVGTLAFWSVYNLSYGALVLHAKHAVDRVAFGRVIPPEWFSSLNPAFIIALTPLVAWFDRPNPQNGRARTRLGSKLVVGMSLVAFSFVVLSLAPSAHPGWLVLAYGLLSAGELLVSAAAISAVTSWAPRGQTARFLSLYFLTISAGGWVAGAAVGAVPNLRELFHHSATAAGLGMMWFLLNAARFDRQERAVADARAAIDNLQKHQQILADAGFFRFKREIVLCENINGRLVFDSTGMLSEQLRSDVMQYPNSPEFTYAKPISYEEAVASYDLKDCAKNIFATLKPFGEHMASTRQNSNDSLETIKLIVEENKQLNPKSAG